MYLSRIQLLFNRLTPDMLKKWDSAVPYASHQWLWQLFPQRETRQFLFRQDDHGRFFMLSVVPPLKQHDLFNIETKPFQPQLTEGTLLNFQLRANPVITRNNKRSDVMMDAKYQARLNGVPQQQWWGLQQQAAQSWLEKQGEKHGFHLVAAEPDDFTLWAGGDDAGTQVPVTCVTAYQQHRFVRKSQEKPVTFGSVDFDGTLCITHLGLFKQALFNGLGKSKSLGCGMLMVKRKRQ